METATFKARDVSPTVLRLHPDIRAELVRIAYINKRSLSREIAIRLEESLKTHRTGEGHPPAYTRPNEKGPAVVMSDADQAMLEIFRKLPPEKQLALLSLFR